MRLWNRAQRRLHLKALARFTAVPLGLLFIDTGNTVQLPVPCGGGNCVAGQTAGTQGTPGFQTPPAGFVSSGKATAVSSGNTLTVSQTSNQAILNWASFNVSADGKVTFQQPSSISIALNKIYQASPSSIFGQVTANGQLYLINPNGFVFGSSATVNVAGLIASSLGLYNGDPELASGILSPIHQPTPAPALASDSRVYVTDSAGNPVLDSNGKPQPVQIIVQPGAQLTAASGGRLMLAGQQVENGGSLSAPDGQIILAAGQSVYLAASGNDPNLRGLIVEVNNNATPGNGGTPSALPVGTVTNDAGGTLSAARGNISLIGLAVNQSGRISATTAVSANGSVILQAAGGQGNNVNGVTCSNSALLCATQGGTLTLGATSEIDVLPEIAATTTTAAAAQTQLQSVVKLTGQQVDIEGGQINAPGGTLKVLAAANPDVGLQTEGNTAAQIRVASGTRIDLAGSNANVPMSANLLSIQLRANELEDDPAQRNNAALHGQTVIVDMRAGRPAIISDPAWISALSGVQENIAQRTSVGGSASFLSEGDVVVNPGSTINVSGGQWTYASGVTQTSQLIGANGKTYNISTANPLLTYTGVLNPTFTQTYNGLGIQITQPTPGFSHFESGYAQGFSAGSVQFAAPSLSLQGTLVGSAVNGPYQRSAATIPGESFSAVLASLNDPTNANPNTTFRGMAFGGTLTIGDAAAPTGAGALPYFFSPPVSFAASVAPIIVADGTPLPPQTLELPASYLTSSGFARTQIYGDSTVTLPAGLPLNLGAGSSLQVVAPRIVIGSDIQALAGTIELQSAQTADYASAALPRLGIDIGDGVTLDVRGQWTNDSPLSLGTAVAPTYQNGGQIHLSLTSPLSSTTSAGELVIGNNVNLEASGGAWVKANNTVVGGAGGKITLDASPHQSALQVGNNVALDAFGVEGAAGGTFSLSAPRVTVDQGNGSWAASQRIDDLSSPGAAFDLGAALFSQYGFSAVNLTGTAPVQATEPSTDVVTVSAGTLINAQAQTLQLSPGYLTRPTDGTVRSFANAVTLPEFARTPESIRFNSVPGEPSATAIGDIDIQKGVSITTDPGSTITLQSQGSILVGGALRAPGGAIQATIALPGTLTDPGFLPNQRVELGSQAVLDVGGTTVMTPNRLNLALGTGTVMPGGKVSIQAARGQVIADPGSAIDIAGASALLDTKTSGGAGGYAAATIGSAGGSLLVQASESISLLGNLSAAAGASSAGTLQGGSLEVDLTPVPSLVQSPATNALPFPATPLTIDLVSSTAGASPSASYGNLAVLGITELEQSGIDVLKLRSDNTIALNSDTPLSLGREISLDARNIAVSYATNASLNAPYVALIDSNSGVTAAQTASGGTGSLAVSAQQIVLSGFTGLQGVGSATLATSGDVELEPVSTSQLAGGLAVAGNLTIDAGRIYPATNTAFTLTDSSTTGTIKIGPSTVSPGTPLSAGGRLEIDAANIDSSGTILAPFGSITLAASNSLTLESGSVTSVSADGMTVPYGQTSLGQGEWIYAAGNSTSRVTGVPSRQVSLTAPKISFASGATINLSGGGDLSSYEWVPGTRGSLDALGQANAARAGLYAVLPATLGQYAAYDLQEFTGSNVGPGSSVYLSGVAGLASGVYPLLPARYALLPGAYLIQVESAFQSLKPGVIGALSDGTPVVAGYMTFGNSGLQSSAGYSGFAVWPGTYGQSLAQYTISTASSFFAAQAARAGQTRVELPADAGTLLIAAGNSLNALGKVDSSAASGGSAATIEISATDLTVTDGSPGAANGGVAIGAPVIQSWNAGDLILGGELSADGSSITVTANTVTIGAGAQFSAGQVLAVADQGIDVQAGATVASNSGMSGTALKTLPSSSPVTFNHPPASAGTPGTADPGASLLVVSDTGLPIASRPAGTVSGGGTINIEAGATLSTRGAVALDAPAGAVVAGNINAPGASWSLGSNSIAFVGAGSSATTPSDTLQIGPVLSSEMAAAGAVRLASAGAIDLFTPVMLGASGTSSPPTLGSLTLVADSINNTAGGSSVFGAQTVTLQGVGVNAPTPTAGSGTLTLVVNTLNIGGTNLAINGNSQTNLQVSGAVVGQAAGAAGQDTGSLGIAGSLSITAAELTAASPTPASLPSAAGTTNGGATNGPLITGTTLAATGTLQIAQNGTAASAASMTASLGGNLHLTASQIQDAGSIIVPGGRVSLQATSDLNLSPGAVVDTRGITVSAGDQTRGAAGGMVNIAALGNLTLAKGSSINVAGAGEAPGGYLTLMGGKDVTVEGTVAGGAAADAIGGNFSLTAGGRLVDGLSSLATGLSGNGFTNQISVRAGSGNLDLASGNSLTAGRITLTADTGAVDISGALTAPAAGQSGFIGLYGGTGVTLPSGSVLEADGIASAGHGGEIEISSTCSTCAVTLNSGSILKTSGGTDLGRLVIEAPIYGTNDVAINVGQSGLGANVSGVGKVILEPVLVDLAGANATIATQLPNDVSQMSTYLTSATAQITSRLTAASAGGKSPVISVQGGVQIADTHNEALTVPSLDLSTYSNLSNPAAVSQPQVLNLTVHAAGGLTIGGNISDGYYNGELYNSGADSASLRFVAGADLNSANPLATPVALAGSTGADLNVGMTGAPAMVSTGTGNIALVASGNVNFSAGSSAFTTGTLGAPSGTVRIKGGTATQDFPSDGGNVLVSAGGDVIAAPVQVSVSSWQLRNLKHPTPDITLGQWGVNLAGFAQEPWSLATFGGGDLGVTAGHDVTNVSAASADSLAVAAGIQTHFAGGGLSVVAGRNITTSQFFVADGIGTFNAGQSFATNLTATSIDRPGTPVGSLFALEDARISLWAENDIKIDAIINPTILVQPKLNSGGTAYFVTYGPESALNAQSSSGAVTLSTSDTSIDLLVGNTVETATNADYNGFILAPPRLSLASLTKDVTASALLSPSDDGQLQLFAGRDIVGGRLAMSDAPAGAFPTPASPGSGLQGVGNLLTYGAGSAYDFFSGRHGNDTRPASIVAGRDIDTLNLSLPKAGRVEAGRDVVNLLYTGQNLNVGDLTLISAGRDFADPLTFNANGSPNPTGVVQVGGPGRLDILAGRNIYLGFSEGVTTVGNLKNANLSTAIGADITMLAGLGQDPNYSAFYQKIIEPSATYQQQLVTYVESLTGQNNLSVAQAETAFTGFTADQQRALIDKVFFNELDLSGIEANTTPRVGFTRGYAAIDTLFPYSRTGAAGHANNPYGGDLNLTYSQIYTLSGGNISLLVPGGVINAGLANAPSRVATKPPSQLGIVAQGAGNVDIYASSDVNVNASRIFTLGGGNILIWSDEGNIDAGNGAKSSLSLPPPTTTVDTAGNVVLVFDAGVAGSGIRTIQTSSSEAAGSVNLIAPAGSVNAGDAGIGAAGNINIAAVTVTGVGNINFGGTATGVPAQVSGLTASLSGAASAASSATTSATSALESSGNKQEAAPVTQAAVSWLDVFVTGLGEENCKTDDVECLKRQKHD